MRTASLRLTGRLDDGAEVYRSDYLVADFGAPMLDEDLWW